MKMTLKEIQELLGFEVELIAEKPCDIGSVVNIAGINWIVLDKDEDGNAICITKNIIDVSVFDNHTGCLRTKYDVSCICEKLNDEFLKFLTCEIGENQILNIEMDLTTEDGVSDYGKITTKIGLLTADMYRKHNRTIRKYPVEDSWWLATPTCFEYNYIRCVAPNGSIYDEECLCKKGIRPVCVFSSSVFKS